LFCVVLWRIVSGIAVVAALAGFFAFVGATVLQTADALPGQVRPTLYTDPAVTPPERGGGLDLMIVHGPPSGTARGMQYVILGTLIGGIPLALVGLALVRATAACVVGSGRVSGRRCSSARSLFSWPAWVSRPPCSSVC
jgi:hypothetical protein